MRLSFTDIRGSTQLLKRLSDSYAEVLAPINRLSQRVTRRLRAAGDRRPGRSFFVAFGRHRCGRGLGLEPPAEPRRAPLAGRGATERAHAVLAQSKPDHGRERYRRGFAFAPGGAHLRGRPRGRSIVSRTDSGAAGATLYGCVPSAQHREASAERTSTSRNGCSSSSHRAWQRELLASGAQRPTTLRRPRGQARRGGCDDLGASVAASRPAGARRRDLRCGGCQGRHRRC